MKKNMEPFNTVQKVFWQIMCKLEDHYCLKTKEIDRKNDQQKDYFYCEKKRICPLFSMLSNKADPKEQSMIAHKFFQQLLCKL